MGRTQAVQQVDMTIRRGEIYGFLGPNGAGKTTTIRMLLGLIKPTQGSIHIFGKELGKHRMEILRKVGSLVEYPSFYGHLTAYENLEIVRMLLGAPKSAIEEALSIVRLAKDAKRPVKGFSLGMKQRLGIATALVGKPELLILDEPTNGLDPSGILEIRELIKTLPREFGVTVLVSSHLLSEIEQMATHVGIIAKGKLIFQDAIGVLQKQAKSRIRMQVSQAEQACGLLHQHGYVCEQDGESALHFSAVEDAHIATAVRILVQHDISVFRIEEQKKSLEDIFLKLTGGEASL
jgi:ABC-2 type transport system ATP-binding protein